MSIDRVDGSKGYQPDNCVWADITTQNRNRSNVYDVNINGKDVSLVEAVEHFGVVNYKTAQARIKKLGWSPLRAASTPSRT
jgi:hypothetical protein